MSLPEAIGNPATGTRVDVNCGLCTSILHRPNALVSTLSSRLPWLSSLDWKSANGI